jgi:hypothetical protein
VEADLAGQEDDALVGGKEQPFDGAQGKQQGKH